MRRTPWARRGQEGRAQACRRLALIESPVTMSPVPSATWTLKACSTAMESGGSLAAGLSEVAWAEGGCVRPWQRLYLLRRPCPHPGTGRWGFLHQVTFGLESEPNGETYKWGN